MRAPTLVVAAERAFAMPTRNLGRAQDLAKISQENPADNEVLSNSSYVPTQQNGANGTVAAVGNKSFTYSNGHSAKHRKDPTPFSKAFPPKGAGLPEKLKAALATWRPTHRLVSAKEKAVKHKPK